jgi:hypothetical protein
MASICLWRGALTKMTSTTMSSLLKNLPTATFNTVFDMVMLNGSALHKHQISNLSLTNMSIPNEKTIICNGTAIINIKEEPVSDVPISARTLDDKVINIGRSSKDNESFL